MIHPELHTNPVALDREKHRLLRLRRDLDDSAHFATLNSCFVVAGEFAQACKEFPLLWIRAGQDDKGVPQVAPIAVFGLTKHSNLCIEGGRWRMQHVPLIMRMYPFALARSNGDLWAVCYDASSPRFSLTEGEALFDTDGQPTAFTLDIQQQLEQIEADVERTRQAGHELLQRDLLRDMRFEVQVPSGSALQVDGFLTVDDERFGTLSDADVLALHHKGLLPLIHAHRVSLSNMQRLAQWHLDRLAAASAPAAGAPKAPQP